jgi:thiaminase/transcriptional activator TenA
MSSRRAFPRPSPRSGPPGRFSDELRREADPVWDAQFEHPFNRGIADGTLDPERFRHFIRQDYVFLIEYARVLSLASARAPRLEWQERFARLAVETLETEMELHRVYAAEWGISVAELEAEPAAPTTRGYVDFLLETASRDDFAQLVAALLPCLWGYSELGLRLAAEEHAPRYARWIELYADEEFAGLAAWCRGVVDSVADGLEEEGRSRLHAAFLACSRFELAFWEMAWRLETPGGQT